MYFPANQMKLYVILKGRCEGEDRTGKSKEIPIIYIHLIQFTINLKINQFQEIMLFPLIARPFEQIL